MGLAEDDELLGPIRLPLHERQENKRLGLWFHRDLVKM
jgi:hypothetical protein